MTWIKNREIKTKYRAKKDISLFIFISIEMWRKFYHVIFVAVVTTEKANYRPFTFWLNTSPIPHFSPEILISNLQENQEINFWLKIPIWKKKIAINFYQKIFIFSFWQNKRDISIKPIINWRWWEYIGERRIFLIFCMITKKIFVQWILQ